MIKYEKSRDAHNFILETPEMDETHPRTKGVQAVKRGNFWAVRIWIGDARWQEIETVETETDAIGRAALLAGKSF